MAPIELDDYGPVPTTSSSASTSISQTDPLLRDTTPRHARFASPQPDDPHYGRSGGGGDDDVGDLNDVSTTRTWRSRPHRNRSSSNPSPFFPNSRRFPLLLVGLIGVPVLLLSLLYGIIRGNAPELLPDIRLPDILGSIKGQTLAARCVCGSDRGKTGFEGKRVCEVYGEEGLMRSRLHEGTGNRIKRFVQQAKTGR
jgi:hypothetical protein